jgi:hypothetical protein
MYKKPILAFIRKCSLWSRLSNSFKGREVFSETSIISVASWSKSLKE